MSEHPKQAEADRRKKWREANQLQAFFDARPDLRLGPIEAGESPDFVMDGPRRIGVEVVEIRGNAQVSQLERYKVDALDEAHRLFGQGAGPPLLVTVGWHRFASMPPLHSDEVGQRLAGLVREAIDGFGTEFIIGTEDRRIEAAGLTGILGNFQIERFCPPFESWRAPSVVFWRPNRPRVEELIAQKNQKLQKFGACDEQWLLMVAEGKSNSGFVDCKRVAACEYDFDFNRIFAMEVWTKEVFELRQTSRVR